MKYLIFVLLFSGCQIGPYISKKETEMDKIISGETSIKNIGNFQLCAAINKTKGREDLVKEFYSRGMDKSIRINIAKESELPSIGMNFSEFLCLCNLNIISQSMSLYEKKHYLHLVVSIGTSGPFRIMFENGVIRNISN